MGVEDGHAIVDDRRHLGIRIHRQERRQVLLAFENIDGDDLVRQLQFFKEHGDFHRVRRRVEIQFPHFGILPAWLAGRVRFGGWGRSAAIREHERHLRPRRLHLDARNQLRRQDGRRIVRRGDAENPRAGGRIEGMRGLHEIVQTLDQLGQFGPQGDGVGSRNHSPPGGGGNEQRIVEQLPQPGQPRR
jgi:hypothetical protein